MKKNCWVALVLLISAPVGGAGEFRWNVREPVAEARAVDGAEWHAIKDPSVVFHGGKWHLFCTVRGAPRSHAVVHCAFEKWEDAHGAERRVLPMHPGYFCAPQVFYFSPGKKWYLICQASDEGWDPKYGAAYSTTEDIGDPDSWSKLRPLGLPKTPDGKAGLDFWVICDESKAHLFFTSLDGRMHRSETELGKFPNGWSVPKLALRGDIFEASHLYKIKGKPGYVAVIEAQGGHGWRYFKAYTNERLDGDGEWKALAATKEDAFANLKNVEQIAGRWTDSISHGEFLRAGSDERLEVELEGARMVFQGVLDKDQGRKGYGGIPWKLGLLERVE